MGHELTHGFDDRGKFVTITKPVIRTHSITHLNEDSKIYKGLKYKVNRTRFFRLFFSHFFSSRFLSALQNDDKIVIEFMLHSFCGSMKISSAVRA